MVKAELILLHLPHSLREILLRQPHRAGLRRSLKKSTMVDVMAIVPIVLRTMDTVMGVGIMAVITSVAANLVATEVAVALIN